MSNLTGKQILSSPDAMTNYLSTKNAADYFAPLGEYKDKMTPAGAMNVGKYTNDMMAAKRAYELEREKFAHQKDMDEQEMYLNTMKTIAAISGSSGGYSSGGYYSGGYNSSGTSTSADSVDPTGAVGFPLSTMRVSYQEARSKGMSTTDAITAAITSARQYTSNDIDNVNAAAIMLVQELEQQNQLPTMLNPLNYAEQQVQQSISNNPYAGDAGQYFKDYLQGDVSYQQSIIEPDSSAITSAVSKLLNK